MARSTPGSDLLRRRAGSPVWMMDAVIAGARVRKSTGETDKPAAAAAALALKAALEASQGASVLTRILTLTDACRRYAAERPQQANPSAAGVLVLAIGGAVPLSAIDDNRMSAAVQALSEQAPRNRPDDRLSPSTVNRYLGYLAQVTNRAKAIWGADVGPWDRAKHLQREPRGRETYLDHEQARRLLDALCPHARPIVLLDLMTGMRKGNVINLRWEEVSLDMRRAVMIQKGGRPLAVELVPEAVALLVQVAPQDADRHGPVWTFGNPAIDCGCPHCASPLYQGQPITSIRRSFATAVRKAGIATSNGGRLRFHDLRHTFASWLLERSGDLKLVQDALGHADIGSTSRYAHIGRGRKGVEIAKAVAPLFNVNRKQTA